jgi:hypothetical protein
MARSMTESLTHLTNWRGIAKGIGFMIGPWHQKVISREPLQEEGRNNRSF